MDNFPTDQITEDVSIGYWIKRRRKTLDMTQKDLANRVGCALITIAKIEADERKPSREIAELLAEHLNIPEEQRALFVQILRGLKSSMQLRKIGVPGVQAPEPTDIPSTISSPEAEKLRGMELIGRISRSKLVERGAEVAIGRNLWELAKSGESQALVIQGEPGIGKSRLSRELAAEIKTKGGLTVVGECFAEGDMPYAPFVRILQYETILSTDLPVSVLADLKTIAPHLEVHLANIPANPPLGPQAEQLRLFESVFTYFQSLYKKEPLLILIEDAHWADHGSIALLQSLVHRFRQAHASVLMVLTTRDISASGSPALNNFFGDLLRSHLSTTVHLERFGQNGTRELLAAIFAQDITDEFIELMHRETQGNPFFIEEVCKDLVESKQIYWDKGRWERKTLTELRVPQNIRAAIQTRLSKLGKETLELLQTASVIGRRFEFDVLKNAMRAVNDDEMIEILEVVQSAQIIQETGLTSYGGVFEFSHVLIASVLRDGLSTPRRQNTHKRIVEALEKIHPNDFSLLAYHSREAGENQSAASYYHKAGDLAMRTFAHEDAIRFYSEALSFAAQDSTQACELLLARAKVYDLRGERSLQIQDLQAAEAKAESIGETASRAAVALARGEYAIQMTEQSEVIEFAKRAIALSERNNLSSITAQAYMLWGRALSEMGDLTESREHLLHAAKIARDAGLGLIEARSMINSGNIDYRLGDYEAAREKYLISLKTIRALGERRIECMVINNLGNIQWVQGDLETALYSYKQTLEIARSIGDRLNEARGLSNIGSILTEQYQYAEAIEALEQALPILRELGQQVDESIVLGHLGDVMEALGRYEDAYKYKSEARVIMHEAEDPQGESEMLTGVSRIETFRKNFENAELSARQAISLAAQHEYRVEEAAAWQQLGFSKAIEEKWDESEQAYFRALELFDTLKQENKSVELRAELARIAHQRGDDEQATKHLAVILPDRTTDTLKKIQQPAICWCCYEVLQGKEPETASLLLQDGYAIVNETAIKITDPGARKHYLQKLPHHAEIVEASKKRSSK